MFQDKRFSGSGYLQTVPFQVCGSFDYGSNAAINTGDSISFAVWVSESSQAIAIIDDVYIGNDTTRDLIYSPSVCTVNPSTDILPSFGDNNASRVFVPLGLSSRAIDNAVTEQVFTGCRRTVIAAPTNGAMGMRCTNALDSRVVESGSMYICGHNSQATDGALFYNNNTYFEFELHNSGATIGAGTDDGRVRITVHGRMVLEQFA